MRQNRAGWRLSRLPMNGQEPQEQDIGKVTFYELGNRYQLLDLVYQIREHVFLIISQPVAPIQESVEIAKRFALICGILWLLVAIIGALIFSRKLTKPLLKLKEQSLRMLFFKTIFFPLRDGLSDAASDDR